MNVNNKHNKKLRILTEQNHSINPKSLLYTARQAPIILHTNEKVKSINIYFVQNFSVGDFFI